MGIGKDQPPLPSSGFDDGRMSHQFRRIEIDPILTLPLRPGNLPLAHVGKRDISDLEIGPRSLIDCQAERFGSLLERELRWPPDADRKDCRQILPDRMIGNSLNPYLTTGAGQPLGQGHPFERHQTQRRRAGKSETRPPAETEIAPSLLHESPQAHLAAFTQRGHLMRRPSTRNHQHPVTVQRPSSHLLPAQ